MVRWRIALSSLSGNDVFPVGTESQINDGCTRNLRSAVLVPNQAYLWVPITLRLADSHSQWRHDVAPPPTPKEAFKIATQNSFDYSSFVFVGITSAMAEGTDAHPQLGKGLPWFGRYYWRGFVDKTDGNYWVIFILPTAFYQDTRYFAMGDGSIWKRGTYAARRVFVARDYEGNNTFNVSELLGRGVAQGISTT